MVMCHFMVMCKMCLLILINSQYVNMHAKKQLVNSENWFLY